MATVAIASVTTEFPWQGNSAPELRVFARVPFFSGTTPIHAGNITGYGRAWLEAACTLDGSNRVVIPAISLPATTDSSRPTEKLYQAYLYSPSANGSGQYQEFSIFGSPFAVDHSDLTQTWDQVRATNEATLPSYATDATITGTVTAGAFVGSGAGLTGIPSGSWSTLNADLTAAWPLEEASGTRSDTRGTNHLTNNGGVTQAAGKTGYAAQFTAASSQSLSIADNADTSTGNIDFTITLHVYFDTIPASSFGIVGKWVMAGNQREYLLYKRSDNKLEFVVSSDGAVGTVVAATSASAISATTWYFVRVWHDSVLNTINLQIDNGTPVSTSHSTGVFNGTSAFVLGAFDGAANFHNGRIARVHFWKKVLTTGEATEVYASGAFRMYPFGPLGSAGSLSNTGSLTIGADTEVDGVGIIDLQTRNLTRLRIANDGTVTVYNHLDMPSGTMATKASGIIGQSGNIDVRQFLDQNTSGVDKRVFGAVFQINSSVTGTGTRDQLSVYGAARALTGSNANVFGGNFLAQIDAGATAVSVVGAEFNVNNNLRDLTGEADTLNPVGVQSVQGGTFRGKWAYVVAKGTGAAKWLGGVKFSGDAVSDFVIDAGATTVMRVLVMPNNGSVLGKRTGAGLEHELLTLDSSDNIVFARGNLIGAQASAILVIMGDNKEFSVRNQANVTVFKVDEAAGAAFVWDGSLKQVVFGANDSGGAGFRMMRVAN